MPLPASFCWTRFGTEAGQRVSEILARKEDERVANGGVFLWGIGNAIGPSIIELVQSGVQPEAVFSPIRSSPRREDAQPASVVYWTKATTVAGDRYELPACSMVTSRAGIGNLLPRHYALVCYRESPLALEKTSDRVYFAGLRNVRTNRPVGASQVTAVVRVAAHAQHAEAALSYDVAFRARLLPPYFIVLRDPVPLSQTGHCSDWSEVVRQYWQIKRQYHQHA